MRRMAVLGGILILLAVIVTPTLRGYLQQKSQIEGLSKQVEQQRSQVATLEAQKKQWQNPAFVASKARSELMFAKPGEKITVYVDSSGRAHDSGPVVTPPGSRNPWYGQLWDSVRSASTKK